MIDIHSHVLHDTDDGARSLEDAVKLCLIAEEQGITDIILTPHFADYEQIEQFVSHRDNKLKELLSALEYEGIDVNIHTGCELYLDDYIYSAPNLDAVTLCRSRYMLCEFSLRHFDIDEALGWIDELIKRGYTPILAHPERYRPFIHTPEFLNEFVSRKILFQVNADSLTGENGKKCFNLACELLENNLVDFISSDAHSPDARPNNLLTKSKYFPDFLETEALEKLLNENPALVIGDRKIFLPERGVL
jgi:protein-tyrosine phosphatase